MELTKDLSRENMPTPIIHKRSVTSPEVSLDLDDDNHINTRKMSAEEISVQLEAILLERIDHGDDEALFQLGQVLFEQGEYGQSVTYFEQASSKGDLQAKFQLGVILYDGLADTTDHKRAMELMAEVESSGSKRAKHLLRAAQYNLGRAHFQGFGVQQSDECAEKYWLLAADDGNPKASIKAQSTLGMFYSRPESNDLKNAFFWHSEACGNGSLESQGALGVMYLHGLGTKKDVDSAFICLREAAERGNIYATGNLAAYYYRRKLYGRAVHLSARVSQFSDVETIAEETDCLASYIAKGIAMGCFYYGRCLHQGMGVKKDPQIAKDYYSKCYNMDPDLCATLQASTQHGQI